MHKLAINATNKFLTFFNFSHQSFIKWSKEHDLDKRAPTQSKKLLYLEQYVKTYNCVFNDKSCNFAQLTLF